MIDGLVLSQAIGRQDQKNDRVDETERSSRRLADVSLIVVQISS